MFTIVFDESNKKFMIVWGSKTNIKTPVFGVRDLEFILPGEIDNLKNIYFKLSSCATEYTINEDGLYVFDETNENEYVEKLYSIMFLEDKSTFAIVESKESNIVKHSMNDKSLTFNTLDEAVDSVTSLTIRFVNDIENDLYSIGVYTLIKCQNCGKYFPFTRKKYLQFRENNKILPSTCGRCIR